MVGSAPSKVIEEGCLYWDHRRGGVRGRTLASGVASLGLRAGDRLEPNSDLMDVGLFSATRTPFTCRFWRARFLDNVCLDSVNHRNPLFDRSIFVCPADTFCLDVLHILYLGVHQKLIGCIVWEVLRGNPWQLGGTPESIIDVGLTRLKGELLAWYDESGVPTNDRIRDLTRSMIGKDAGARLFHPDCVNRAQNCATISVRDTCDRDGEPASVRGSGAVHENYRVRDAHDLAMGSALG